MLKEVVKEVAIELGKLVAKAVVDEVVTPAVKRWRERRHPEKTVAQEPAES